MSHSDTEVMYLDTFDPSNHIFTRDGVLVPSCTGILQAVGITKVPEHPTALRNFRRAAARGTIIHDLACDILRGEEDLGLFAEGVNYLKGFKQFLKDFTLTRTVTENWLIAEHMGVTYGVIPDIHGWLNGQEAIIEIKTTVKVEDSHSIQTAAQAVALGRENALRAAVYLRPDMSYRFKLHTDPNDFTKWAEALSDVRTNVIS